ncbi:hypothetical protein T439DRAFT_328603, partial [Meredithblackwellia eburnea MCA 4105]
MRLTKGRRKVLDTVDALLVDEGGGEGRLDERCQVSIMSDSILLLRSNLKGHESEKNWKKSTQKKARLITNPSRDLLLDSTTSGSSNLLRLLNPPLITFSLTSPTPPSLLTLLSPPTPSPLHEPHPQVAWTPNSSSLYCQTCPPPATRFSTVKLEKNHVSKGRERTKFSTWNRRHHCRRCGRLICVGCSRWEGEGGEGRQRVCWECFD